MGNELDALDSVSWIVTSYVHCFSLTFFPPRPLSHPVTLCALLNLLLMNHHSYFLTLTSCQPLYGKLSDIFGRKECLLFAYLVFGLGCLGCGLAQSMTQLCVARGVAGVGGGGMTAVVSILVSDIVPLRDRGVWQGYINVIYAAGTATGAPLGGVLADSIGWRWYVFLSPATTMPYPL